MLISPSRGTAAACRAVAAAVCVAVVAAIAASSAQASSLSLQYEPAYTKGTSNQWYTTQYHSNGDAYYYVCASASDDGFAIPGEQSNGSAGPSTLNCGGNTAKGTTDASWALNAATPRHQGHKYDMCFTDYVDWPNPLGGSFWKMQTKLCQSTILDASKPVVSADINGGDEVTKNPSVSLRIGYNDSISPPWNGADGHAANLVCFSKGASCTPADYDASCSVPAAWERVTSFACGATLPSDGTWYACVRSSDRAIPDMRHWSAVTPNQANVSDTACGSITLDRVGPTVTVDASATTVTVGQVVNFSAQAADGGSGVKGDFAWTFGDNTAGAAGATTSHTYTQPGTYTVSATRADGAGNSGAGTRTITVQHLDTGGDPGGTGGNPGATGGGTGTTGGISIGSLDVSTARTVKVTKQLKKLPLALTADGPGMVRIALLKGAKIVAKGATELAGAGTFAYRLKLPKASKLAAGAYKLKISFTPAGQTRAVIKTIKVKLVRGKKVTGQRPSRS